MSVTNLVGRLTPLAVHTTSSRIPVFAAAPNLQQKSWADWVNDVEAPPAEALPTWLRNRLLDKSKKRIKCIVFGEQHHQPRVLAAQLQLLHTLATPPLSLHVSIVMEHFNLLQQAALDSFANNGDTDALTAEYAKSKEGFRLTPSGYLPLLNLARELDSVKIIAGFPPREWARIIMRGNPGEIPKSDEMASAEVFRGFDRWEDLRVGDAHYAYIRSSISGNPPDATAEPVQGGLPAAQAFKDSVYAWKIDKVLSKSTSDNGIVVAICGSGHCEFDFGATERIQACERDEILLIVTKPDDGALWASSDSASADGPRLADAVIVYEAVDV